MLSLQTIDSLVKPAQPLPKLAASSTWLSKKAPCKAAMPCPQSLIMQAVQCCRLACCEPPSLVSCVTPHAKLCNAVGWPAVSTPVLRALAGKPGAAKRAMFEQFGDDGVDLEGTSLPYLKSLLLLSA